MSDDIRKAVEEQLNAMQVTMSAVYAGETVRGNNWQCDAWRVTFKRTGKADITQDYYKGTGLRKQVQKMPVPAYRKNTIAYEAWAKTAFKPVAPTATDVLYSLLQDSDAVDTSFSDWCDNYGYDSDSLKAFSTYTACCDIGKQLRTMFTYAELDALRNLLQDY